MINNHKSKKTMINNKWNKIIIPSHRELNIYRRLLLKQILNGHKEISDKICNYINEFELDDIKYEYNEINFYNWLNYDLILRNKLGTIQKDFDKLSSDEGKLDFIEKNKNNSLFNYYYYLLPRLGLTWEANNYFRRSKSLTDCFNSQWWRTTEKNNIEWKNIHFIISIDIDIKIYNYELYGDDIYLEYLYNYELFRNPTIRERYIILEYISNNDDFYGDIILIDSKKLQNIIKIQNIIKCLNYFNKVIW